MSFITSGSVTTTPVTIHYINQSTIIQLTIPSANTIKAHYIFEPQQNISPTASWVIMILIITVILLLIKIFHNNRIMLLGKTFSLTSAEAYVDDLAKACALPIIYPHIVLHFAYSVSFRDV